MLRRILGVLRFLVPLSPAWPVDLSSWQTWPWPPEALRMPPEKERPGGSPPPYGLERVGEPTLTPEELELWSCIQGAHGPDCGHHS